MKAAAAHEFAFLANPGSLDFMVGPDWRNSVCLGGLIVGIPHDGFPILRKLLVRSPWEFEYLSHSERLGLHLFLKGSDKLLREQLILALVQD